jgi:RNA polymerase sigma-70 factor, ECF subfamily
MSTIELTDEEIVKKVQNEDIESFGLLMKRYESKLIRYGTRFMSNRDDIKDLVQEVFIKTYTNIKSFDVSKRFSPWIYRIAHNEFINAVKKKKLKPLIFFDADEIFPHPIAPETADGESNERELKTELARCIDKLPIKYREVLVLYYFEELSYEEIAEVLHIPASTVGVRLSRGKAMFKELFKNLN